MLLVIDVGNSNIVFAQMKGEKVIKSWRMETRDKHLPETLKARLGPEAAKIEAGIMGSVVPGITPVLKKAFRDLTGKTLVLADHEKTGVLLKVDQPKKVGIDRVLDTLAATHYFGKPLIIIDFGTATTFNVIDQQGAFIGGAIAGGIQTTLDSLGREAAQLPEISFGKARRLIGRNTGEAMASGAWFGALSMIEGMVARLRKEIGPEAKVVATGGFSTLFQGRTGAIDYFSPELTLQGLRLLYERMGS